MAKPDVILPSTHGGPDPHAENYFESLRQHSMLWLSIAVIKKAAGDLGVARYREDAIAWAREYQDRSYSTSLACCCDWISGALPGDQGIDPRAISQLLLRFPQRVRRVCDRYLQENLPDFHDVYCERARVGFLHLVESTEQQIPAGQPTHAEVETITPAAQQGRGGGPITTPPQQVEQLALAI